MIVLIEKNANGKIEFTKEELEELLEKAREEVVNEGTKRSYIYSPSTTPTYDPFRYQFTCQAGTVATSDTTSETAKINGAPVSNGL